MSRRSRYRPRVRRKRAYFPRRASAARHLKNFSARLERAIAKELTYICSQGATHPSEGWACPLTRR